PVPLPKDPYEAIRHAYLDGTNTESQPFEDPIDTETPESPLTVAPPTSLPESTLPTLVPILRRTTRMVVRIPPAMSSGLSASMAEVAAMYESTFLEDSEEDDDEEDEGIEETLDSNSVSEDAENEGPSIKDGDPAAGDEGLAVGVEGPSTDDEKEEGEDVPGGQPHTASVMGTVVSAPLGLGYGALRHRELALEEDHVYNTFEVGQGSGSALESERPERVSAFRHPTLTTWTDPEDGMVYIDVHAYPPPAPPVQIPPSPDWTSSSLPISLSPSVVPSYISLPMLPLTVLSSVATPATAKTDGFLTELGAQVEIRRGLIRDHAVRLEELSPALFARSLEYGQERIAVTFGAIWRPVLALEWWAGQTDAQRAAMWHTISDIQGENRDLR
ncbi:hypothetical protein Tco_1423027, partial [Tanacetum coccineum]